MNAKQKGRKLGWRLIIRIKECRILTALAFVLALSADPGVVQAECVQASEATSDSTCVVYALNGRRGVWLSLEEAERQRRIRLEVPELRLQVERFTQMDGAQQERISALRESTRLRQQATEQATTQLEASLNREAQLRSEVNAWYRSPALWFAVGVVVTAAAGVALAVAVDR